ncbi:hypothetical protein H7683_21740 [Ectopseudomonas mendocina]|uniref:hypothetical protein n=1 Tax=Ectopseudomonas mendocina TaxID=300 RepID=UPI001ADEF005|nr:hypothetical protein [Pseudomonas mendocina]QTN45565.1 hypothetical protein H7683_21740 [Pseudomonas mendocina]
MLDTIVGIFKAIWQIWSALPESKKEEILTSFTDLMESVFKEFYRANGGATA